MKWLINLFKAQQRDFPKWDLFVLYRDKQSGVYSADVLTVPQHTNAYSIKEWVLKRMDKSMELVVIYPIPEEKIIPNT